MTKDSSQGGEDPDSHRDGPTPEFLQHHEVAHRSSGGKRIRSRLEILLEQGAATPQQFAAGRRFANDYLAGCAGRGRSSLDMSVRGGNEDGTESRHDAYHRFEMARVALDGATRPEAGGARASAIMIACCVLDESFEAIGRKIGDGTARAGARAKEAILVILAALAEHYDRTDSRHGRSGTPYTKDAAMQLVEPADRPLRGQS